MWKQVGERVERLRRDRKLSKAQFGRLIGVSGQYVGRIERGAHGLSVDSIVKICNAAEVSADYILFGMTDPRRDTATITALSGLSYEQIKIALDVIRGVAQFVYTEDGNEVLIREVARQLGRNG